MSKHAIKGRLSKEQLVNTVRSFNKKFVGLRYVHTDSSEVYEVIYVTTVNDNGKSEWGFIYSPVNKKGFTEREILHTRKWSEFFDGRYKLVVPTSDELDVSDRLKRVHESIKVQLSTITDSLENYHLSTRAFNTLARSGYSFNQVIHLTLSELKAIEDMDDATLVEIRTKLPLKAENNYE